MIAPKNKGGRPAYLKKGKRVNVYLDEESIAKAKKLGKGNLSEGVRKAIKESKDGD